MTHCFEMHVSLLEILVLGAMPLARGLRIVSALSFGFPPGPKKVHDEPFVFRRDAAEITHPH